MFPAAGAAILWSAAARRSQKAAFGAVAASLLLLVPAVWNGAPGPLHGYADFPLAVFFLGACYVLIFRAGRHYNRAIPALLGACLPFVKTEGIFLWAAFATVALWTHRARLRPAWAIILPGAVVFGAWQVTLKMLGTPAEGVFRSLTASSLHDALLRLPLVLQHLGLELMDISTWGILWPAAFGVIIWHLQGRRVRGLTLALMLLLPLGADVLPYLFTDMSLQWHLDNSMQRLLLQLAPAALLVIVSALPPASATSSAPLSPKCP
jgi:hypothetical protein